jgi:DNA-binding MarR family transcriptional regulator
MDGVPPHCAIRFGGSLTRDAAGCLYDQRFRELLTKMGLTLHDVNLGAVEALAAVRVAARGIRLLVDRQADQHGLTEGRMQLLFRLALSDDHQLALGDLALALDVSPRNITGLVDHLEADGLVERIPDPHDRRSIQAQLTPAGLTKISAVLREPVAIPSRIAARLSPEELVLLRDLCYRLVETMASLRAETPRPLTGA